MKISKIILILYIVMIPVSYRAISVWERARCKQEGIEYKYANLIAVSFAAIFWPIGLPGTFLSIHADKTPPSWL